MMANVSHVTSGSGLRKFQADGFLLDRVYIRRVTSSDSNNAIHESRGFECIISDTLFQKEARHGALRLGIFQPLSKSSTASNNLDAYLLVYLSTSGPLQR